ncbi:hypothetical protein [Winogradskyella sp. SYSU M77433]|uniref:beta strand repeat-containing protein n=1 Tax=Winogradskyella sp. SYSU M77433 TaxID=3042722 RepID=UPI00248153C7|nr:hypothetical protein [Winogradskyella sp. SYSU M77433]MDH7913348.1 hypothetical protein [Winogradskyella sp. SYSU M77433]
MKTITITLFLFFSCFAFSQVGVGNTDPKSTLDISASSTTSPTNEDGILIPRIDNFPTTDPTADQDGMMVFYTGTSLSGKGFYYWDNATTSWVSVKGSDSDSDFFEIGTSNPPNSITDDIYTYGKIKIGQNSAASSPLSIYDWNSSNTSSLTISRSLNAASGSGSFNGAYITLNANSSDNYFGVSSFLSGTIQAESANFLAQATGTFNAYTNLFSGRFYSTSGSGRLYGANINFISGITNTGNKYGFNVNIPSSLFGIHYGLYSNVQNTSGYAAYLLGRTSLGDTTANRYLMPAADGTAGQVMTTDGAGNISFQDLPTYTDTDEQDLSSNIVTANEEIEITITNGTSTTINIQDADADSTNETITAAILSGTDLEITEAGSTTTIDLSTLQDGNTQNTLDQAYNEGGLGAGRTIYADNGNVEILGDYGIYVDTNASIQYGSQFISNSSQTESAIYGEVTSSYNLFDRSVIKTTNALTSMNVEINKHSNNTGQDSGVLIDNSGLISGRGVSFEFSDPTTLNYLTTSIGFNHDVSYNGGTAGDIYGFKSHIEGSGGARKFGLEVTIPSTSLGEQYGIFSDVQSTLGYAGYFIGSMSFGNNPSIGRYSMPLSDGAAGQVMTTDGAGNVTFQNPTTNTDDQQIDNLGLVGTVLGISLEDDGVAPVTVDLASINTDNQQIDNFSFNSTTNILTLEIEDDGQAAQTVDLSSLNPTKSIARMYMSLSQTETGGGTTKVNFDTVDFDTNSNFNTTTDEFTVPADGIYRVTVQITLDTSTATGVFGVRIRVDGTQERRSEYNHHGNGELVRQVTSILNLTAGQTIDVAFVRPAVGASINQNARATFFEVEQL